MTRRRLVDVAGVADLQFSMTGRRPAPATIRSYHSRGLMPAQVQPGQWAETDIRRWLTRRRPRPSETQVAGVRQQLVEHIARARTTGDRSALDEAVAAARSHNVSWKTIAEELQVSPQAAWHRHRVVVPRAVTELRRAPAGAGRN